jgi:hypothetical protein
MKTSEALANVAVPAARRHKTVLALSLAAVVVGCSSKPYTVVQQASPNPFKQRGCTLSVDPVAFDRLVVDGVPDATYASQKAPEQQAKYEDDKKAMSFAFKQELIANSSTSLVADAPASGGNAFVLKPSLVTMTNGGDFELVADISDASGSMLDEVRVKGHSAVGLRGAAVPLGQHVARYLKTRLSCAR